MDGKKDNFEENGRGYYIQKDKATQVQEALYYLQTEIDSVKESAAKSIDIANALKELQGEVENLTTSCRADLYALNDKLETNSREQSRNSINMSEEFRKLCEEEKEEIASICKGLQQKFEEELGELSLRTDKLASSLSASENNALNSSLSEISEKLDCVFDAIASYKVSDEKLDKALAKIGASKNAERSEESCNAAFAELSEKLESMEKAFSDKPSEESSVRLDEVLSRLDRIESEALLRDERENAISSKLDKVISLLAEENARKSEQNEELSAVRRSVEELKASHEEITTEGAQTVVAEKPVIDFTSIERRLDAIETSLSDISKADESDREDLADNDDVMRMLEKINNQVSVLLSDSRDKISDIKEELDRFKNNFTTVTGGEAVGSEDELKVSFESLTSELDTLSKLVREDKTGKESVPEAILTVSDELEKLSIDDVSDNSDKSETATEEEAKEDADFIVDLNKLDQMSIDDLIKQSTNGNNSEETSQAEEEKEPLDEQAGNDEKEQLETEPEDALDESVKIVGEIAKECEELSDNESRNVSGDFDNSGSDVDFSSEESDEKEHE